MKEFFAIASIWALVILVGAGLWIGGGFVGLWWYPYQMRAQQKLIVASPGFVATKEQEISTFMMAYSGTTSTRQQKGIAQTICLDASQVDVSLPAPEMRFVARHCN
jgi:hypothetical protein